MSSHDPSFNDLTCPVLLNPYETPRYEPLPRDSRSARELVRALRKTLPLSVWELPDLIVKSGIISWFSGSMCLSLGGSVANRIVDMAHGVKLTPTGVVCMAADLVFGGACAVAFSVYTIVFVLSTSQFASLMVSPIGNEEDKAKDAA